MDSSQSSGAGSFLSAVQFWEHGRIWYNAVLSAVVLSWVLFTWPHFRPALTPEVLGAMLVLAFLANVCYCAAYFTDIAMQALVPNARWHRFRQTLWLVGMLFAILIENYWIADEIYPDVGQGPPDPFQGAHAMWTGTIASNINFPAPLAVLGFLAAVVGIFVAAPAVLIFWFARKPKFMRWTGISVGTAAVVYLALLVGFSTASRTRILAHGQEKYFCEIDCHLAYAVLDVKAQPGADLNDYVVTLRTRFDETTTSPQRPKDALLTPSPREVRVIDSAGREYTPISSTGTSLMTPLKPADSYTTELEFRIPKDAGGLRLLLNTIPGWPDHLVIGDENSFLHKKTYFAL